MNSKKNSFKRVAAGALAVLTVAAYTAPVANVGGLPNGLVANAEAGDTWTLTWGGVNKYIKTIKVGSETFNGDPSKSTNYIFTEGVATITSSAPLDTTTFGVTNDNLSANAALTQAEIDEKLSKGEGYTSTYKNNIYTYQFKLDQAVTLAGVAVNVSGAYKNGIDPSNVANLAESGAVTVADNEFLVDGDTTYIALTDAVASAQYDIVARGTKNAHFTIERKGDKIQKGISVYASAVPFKVEITGNATTSENVSATAKYNKKTGKYEAEVTLPVPYQYTADDEAANAAHVAGTYADLAATFTVVKKTAYTYTKSADDTVLTAGSDIADDVVAASITAKATRPEVHDYTTNAVTAAKIDNDNFKTKSSIDYLGRIPYEKYVAMEAALKTQACAIAADGYWYNPGAATTEASADTIKGKNITELVEGYYAKASAGTANYTLEQAKVEVTLKRFTTENLTVTGSNGTDEMLVTITKDGAAYTDATDGVITNKNYAAGTAITGGYSKTFTFDKAGKYVITETVNVKNATGGIEPKSVSYEFTIAPYVLSASDITIQLNDARVTPKGMKFTDGKVLEIEVPKIEGAGGIEPGTTTFTPTITLNPEVNMQKTGAAAVGQNKYELNAPASVTALDTINTATVKVYDENYGAPSGSYKSVDVQFKLVKAKEKPEVTIVEDSALEKTVTGGVHYLKVAESQLDEAKLTKLIWDNLEGNDVVNDNMKKITYSYLEGWKNINDDELDERTEGFPETKGEDGLYSIYIELGDTDVYLLKIQVVDYVVNIVPSDASLNITYGDIVGFDGYKLTDEDGKTVKGAKLEDVRISKINEAVLYTTGSKKGTPKKDVEGNYQVGAVIGTDEATLNSLDAGKYIIELTGDPADADAAYTINTQQYVLTVEKKQLTADMFTIEPKNYEKNTTKTVTAAQIAFKFKNEDGSVDIDSNVGAAAYKLGITDGATSKTEIGTYKLTVTATSTSDNFTGSVQVPWSIVLPINATETAAAAGHNSSTKGMFTWSDDLTTIYDEGRIHVQFDRKADTKLTATDGNGKKVTVTDFGVVLDKKGIIPAPEDYYYTAAEYTTRNSDEYQKAEQLLQYGNGGTGDDAMFTFGHVKTVSNSLYGANVEILNVETGMWIRPYAILSDNTVVYGTPIYKDIVKETERALQIKLNPATKVDKTNSLVGYNANNNSFRVYSSYTKLDSSVKAQILDFGVVVDKTGKFDEFGADAFGANSTTLAALKADYTTKKAVSDAAGATAAQKAATATAKAKYDNFKKVTDELKLGKKFIEGHRKTGSTKMTTEEYGANISPVNSLTGIWVRSYVKLRDDLVVYSEPEFISNVSDYYKVATNNQSDKTTAITPALIPTAKDGVKHVLKFSNAIQNNNTEYTFVKMGVVVDKSGSLLNTNGELKDAAVADKKLVLGKGFTEGKKTVANAEYIAKVTPTGNTPIVSRPYVVFKVNGKEITVYGDIVVNK